MSRKPSQSQIDYARHLLKQVGADEPDWDKIDAIEISTLIDDLKKKRGRPVWYGNGQFSHWEKKATMGDRQAARPAKPLSPEKLNALLQKVRKNVSNIGWDAINAAVPALGGKVETVAVLGNPREDWIAYDQYPNFFTDEQAKDKADELRRRVTRPPTTPEIGKQYILGVRVEVSELTKTPAVVVTQVRGEARTRITLDGHTSPLFEYLSDHAQKWLKDTAHWDTLAAAALGMEEHARAGERAVEGVGTCGACFGVYKLKPKGRGLPTVTLHGYERPGSGQISGRCSGAGQPPFELSVAATEEELNWQLSFIRVHETDLQDLKSGKTTKITPDMYGARGTRVWTPDDEKWPEVVEMYEKALKHRIATFEKQVPALKALVSHWKPRPLPEPGKKVIDWYNKGRTASRSMTVRVAARYLESIR